MYNNRGNFRGNQNTRFKNFRGGFGGRPRQPRRRFGENIDPSLFIKKAQEFQNIKDVETKNNFEDFNLCEQLYKNIKDKGYIKPTPIQDQVIGEVLIGKDVLGVANTGTGKTAAFAIPIINKIIKDPNVRVIILAPTRELATQIKQEFRSFTPNLKVYIALAIGGAGIREQIIDIRRGPHIIIGTPGRIKDLAARRILRFDQFNMVVLDEVDRMLDMGFVNDIKEIMSQIPATRQTLFFSATVNKKVDFLINTLLKNPIKISVKTQDSSTHVDQDIVKVDRNNKKEILISLLKQEHFKKVLIFGETKRLVEELSVTLYHSGFKADSIHGNKPQNKRQRVLQSFKADQINILVATDVAARGLDIADITHVINYSRPNNYDDYIHRIGRTGRGDKKGYALTFVENNY